MVRGAIVQLSALPFKEWYKRKYGIDIGSKTNETGEVPLTEEELKQVKLIMHLKLNIFVLV